MATLLSTLSLRSVSADPLPPTDARAAFESALDLVGRDDAQAAIRLEAVAAADEHGPYASDALIEAAQLDEEKLGRPDRARDLYAALLARDPQSRLALRARARLEFLDANLKSGAAPLAAYQRILYGFSTRPTAESARLMEALLVTYPDFVLADKAALWLAGLDEHEGRYAAAERRYERIEQRSPRTGSWSLARKGRADCALESGHPLSAARLYQSLLDEPIVDGGGTESIADSARAGLRRAATALQRLCAFYLSLAFLAAYLFVKLRAARPLRFPRPLPLELVFYVPVAGLFVACGLSENRMIAEATIGLALGGAILVAVSSLATERALSRAPMSALMRARATLALTLAALALVYAVMHASHLTDFIVETMQNGPER